MRHFFIGVLEITAQLMGVGIVLLFATGLATRSEFPVLLFIIDTILGLVAASLFLGILLLLLTMN
jgi:hypothetical protein